MKPGRVELSEELEEIVLAHFGGSSLGVAPPLEKRQDGRLVKTWQIRREACKRGGRKISVEKAGGDDTEAKPAQTPSNGRSYLELLALGHGTRARRKTVSGALRVGRQSLAPLNVPPPKEESSVFSR